MAADCNCSNPSCPCYKGNQDKAGEQQAPGPDAPSGSTTEAAINAETRAIVDQRDKQFRQGWEEADRQVRQTGQSSNTNGGNMASDNFSAAADDSFYEPYSNMGSGGGGSTTASSAGGGNIEVTNTPALRAFYANVRQEMVSLHESSTVAAKELEQRAASYEQSLGWMTTEEFDQETISFATGIQEQIAALATSTNELAARAGETVSNIDAAIAHSLQTHAPLEELVAAGAAKSTASYMGG